MFNPLHHKRFYGITYPSVPNQRMQLLALLTSVFVHLNKVG